MKRFTSTLALIVASLTQLNASADEYAGLFNRLDADGDRRLIAAEVPREHLSLFKRLVRVADANRDGFLTSREFEAGLTPTRPAKPLTEKLENELPGSDALLLMLAWMDLNADLVITRDEVTEKMRPLFDEFIEVLNLENRSRIAVTQLSRQALQFVGRSARFATREGIDVDVEMALLSDDQVAYVDRLRDSLRGRDAMMDGREGAFALFSRLDTNGDGNVAAAEVPPALSDRFSPLLERADRNQDKQLSEQEFMNFAAQFAALKTNTAPRAETTQRARQLIRRSDRDGNGLLSREEAPRRMAQRFSRLDQNGDGSLDSTEVARGAEILETLRNSAAVQPTSAPAKRPRPKNPAQK